MSEVPLQGPAARPSSASFLRKGEVLRPYALTPNTNSCVITPTPATRPPSFGVEGQATELIPRS